MCYVHSRCWQFLLAGLILGGACVGLSGTIGPVYGSSVPQPANATDWFRRADNLTNIRMPGSAHFHLRVAFHAYPGIDFSKPGKSEIITGDGTYEEWWVSPEKWRREVSLAGYHAIEVRADGVRKMQASSDYEPSRVLMLLNALLSPIPRNLLEPRLEKDPPDWTVKHLSVGGLNYVQLSSRWTAPINGITYYTDYNFLPSGVLIRTEDRTSMMTSWQGFTPFATRIVPGQIAVQAMGRPLLAATVQIEPLPGTYDIAQLPGPAAPPGNTLRPIHGWEAELKILNPSWAMVGNWERFAFRRVVDRDGKSREVELLATADINVAKAVLPHMRAEKFVPPTMDGSPCELATATMY